VRWAKRDRRGGERLVPALVTRRLLVVVRWGQGDHFFAAVRTELVDTEREFQSVEEPTWVGGTEITFTDCHLNLALRFIDDYGRGWEVWIVFGAYDVCEANKSSPFLPLGELPRESDDRFLIGRFGGGSRRGGCIGWRGSRYLMALLAQRHSIIISGLHSLIKHP
jgi:hypothetical protein